MKLIVQSTVAATLFGAIAQTNPVSSQIPLIPVQQPWSQWMADSIMSRGDALQVKPGTVTSTVFKHGMFQMALQRLLQHLPTEQTKTSYNEYLQKSVAAELSEDGHLKYYDPEHTHIIDDLLLGHGLLYLHETLGDEKYLRAAKQLRRSLDTQPRTPEGMYWYRADTSRPDLEYPNTPDQAFVEQIYMLAPFLVRYTNLVDIGNATAVYDDVLLQFQLFQAHCEHAETHLWAQGYDDTKKKPWADPKTGATPEIWGRANGWMAMALVDTLELLPVSHRSDLWIRLHTLYVDLAKAASKAIDAKTGAWWQVMSWPGRKGNFIESSASGMFVYSLYKGLRLGYFENVEDQITIRSSAVKGFQGLIDQFVVYEPEGTLGFNGTVQVRGLGGNFSYEVSYTSIRS
jgi:rhamnogalacturonyl hydrolase YesR